MAIDVREATVHTMTVAIQTLRVGNKQVTMGMFRQLPLVELVDTESLTLRGVPWGHVEYWWDGALPGKFPITHSLQGRRLHLVWVDGKRLCRTVIYAHGQYGTVWEQDVRIQRIRNGLFLADFLTAGAFEGEANLRGSQGEVTGNVTVQGCTYTVAFPIEVCRHLRNYQDITAWLLSPTCPATQRQSYAAQREQVRAAIVTYGDSCGMAHTPEEQDAQWQLLDEVCADRRRVMTQWAHLWTGLCELPQLFIAV